MNYPLISEYISSIFSAEDNLATKTSLRPVLDSTGNPVMSSGNFAVVFKMVDIDNDRHYAMKCFLRDQVGREESYLQICEELEFVESRYLLKIEYLPAELFVDTNQSDESEFPVLLMEWVEGSTLGSFISENYTDSFKMSQVAYNFSKMASWLLSQDFAHGDIKPDNIIIKENGNLVLVDYDGMYVPSMKGSAARENGSPNFRHPERTDKDFDEHIDDFALAVLILTLKVLSLDFDAYSTIAANDYCIFSESDYQYLDNASGLYYIESHLKDSELQKIWGVFLIALSENKLSSISFRLASLSLPSKDGCYSLLTELTEDEKNRKDESGIVVDRSGRRVISANEEKTVLNIPEGIEIICQRALQSKAYKTIVLPESLKAIGGIAFANNTSLNRISIPQNVVFMEHNNPFGGCINLKDINVDSPFFVIDDDCLYSADHQILYSSLFTGHEDTVEVHPDTTMISGNAFWQREVEEIILPQGLSIISGTGAFGKCNKLKRINIPDSVVEVGGSSFMSCSSLETVSFPNSVKKLGRRVDIERARGMFEGCKQLTSVSLPNGIEYIGELFFSRCVSLKNITIPGSVSEIGSRAFEGCESIEEIVIPSNVSIIRERVFAGCKALKSIYIPDSVSVFGDGDPKSMATSPEDLSVFIAFMRFGRGMFSNCSSLETVRLPQWIDRIQEGDFMFCKSLSEISIPDSVTEIEHWGFLKCEKLSFIHMPKQLRTIHDSAFSGCLSLENIVLPEELTTLEACSFENCSSLRTINLPSRLTHLDGNPFPGCADLNIKIESDAFVFSNSALYSFDKTVIHSYLGNKDWSRTVFDGVKHIDRYCFSRSRIETITIPSHICTIKDYAFSFCDELEYVSLYGITEISSNLFNSCKSLCRVSIPSSVTIIRERAFYNCQSIKEIQIPNSVRIIEAAAFSCCSTLSSIVLPDSILDFSHKSSSNGIFEYCKELTVVELNSYIPSLQESDFKDCEKLSKIIVPNGDKKKYQNKLGKYFSLIVEQYEYTGEDDLPF